LLAGTVEGLYRELSIRNIDLLLTWELPSAADAQVNFEPLYDDSFVVVAGTGSAWSRKRKIKLAELVNEPWVLPPPDSSIGSIFAGAFRASGLRYPPRTVVALPHDIRMSFLATGRFLTMFHSSVIRFSNRHPGLKVLPIEVPIAPVLNGVVTLKSRTVSPVAQLFIEHARELAGTVKKAT
jgi:DNA-binding transcriptional LysR family regulator